MFRRKVKRIDVYWFRYWGSYVNRQARAFGEDLEVKNPSGLPIILDGLLSASHLEGIFTSFHPFPDKLDNGGSYIVYFNINIYNLMPGASGSTNLHALISKRHCWNSRSQKKVVHCPANDRIILEVKTH